MTQSGENKELKAAFDEFKELLEKRVEPVFEMPPMPPTAPEPHEQSHAAFGSELRASAPTFKIPVSSELASTTASATPPGHIAPTPRIDHPTQSLLTPKPGQNKRAQPFSPQVQRQAPETSDGRRRKLIYLSGVIIFSGLAALGWTLSKSKHAEEMPELSRAVSPEAAMTSPSENPTGDALNNGQGPASQNLAGQDSAASQDPAPPAQPALAEPATSAEVKQPTQVQPPAPQPPEVTPVAPQSTQAPPPKAKPKIAPVAPSPAKTTPSAEPNPEMSQLPKPKPKVIKPKPKPAASSAPNAAQNPIPAADNAAPPPPPPPSNDGPFGFVKRTVNSITDIGRGAIGGN